MIGIAIETSFLIFLPLVAFLSYLYLVGLRAIVEGLGKGPKLVVLTGVALVWLASVPGPVAFLGAFIITIALVVLAFFDNLKDGLKRIARVFVPSKFKKLLVEGCASQEGCAARYLAAWPALAALAASTEVISGPLTMFVLGAISKPPELKGRLAAFNKLVALIMVLIAWGYAILNIIKNLVLPHWLLMQEYAISGEVSKLPLTARILAHFLGKEASYVYMALLITLAVYTASRVHSALKLEVRRDVIAAIAPFVSYAVSMNKLGEPLTSVAYALGITLAYLMQSRNVKVPSEVVERVLDLFAKIGKGILDYSVPVGPLRRLLA